MGARKAWTGTCAECSETSVNRWYTCIGKDHVNCVFCYYVAVFIALFQSLAEDIWYLHKSTSGLALYPDLVVNDIL